MELQLLVVFGQRVENPSFGADLTVPLKMVDHLFPFWVIAELLILDLVEHGVNLRCC